MNQSFTGFLFLTTVQTPLRIIFLTPGFPVDEADTSCIPALQDFVLAWKETFPAIELRVIAFQYPRKKKRYSWFEIPVYAVGGNMRKGISRYITWINVMKELFRLKFKSNTIIISYFLTEATLVGQIFSRLFNVSQIAIAAGQDVKKENRYLRKIAFRGMKVVTLSETMSQRLQDSCGRKPDYIIPMGFRENANPLQSSPKSSGNDRSTDILIAGSLIALKRVDIALGLFKNLKKEVNDFSVKIAGDGPERKRLEEVRDQNDLNDNVRFLGALKREEVIREMQHAKILLHTSAYEGQATVITEALASGMYVVCFDVGRISDHEKIKVCANESEMLSALKSLLLENRFDFTPVVPATMTESVRQYQAIIQELIAGK